MRLSCGLSSFSQLNAEVDSLRVNFDDEDEKNPRFGALTEEVGSADKARGMLIRFWRLCVKPWGEKLPLAHADFDLGRLGVMLETGWAVEYNGGIQAYDAAARFKWYWDCCEKSRKAKAKRDERKAERAAASANRSDKTPAGHQLESSRTPAGLQLDTSGSPAGDPPIPVLIPVPVLSSKTDRPAELATVHNAREGAPARVDLPDGQSAGQENEFPPGLTLDGLIAIWNDFRHPVMPEADVLDPDLVPGALEALAAHPEASYWQARMKQLIESPFARGEVATESFPQGWVANLGYFVQMHEAIRAGRVDSHSAKRKKQANWRGK